MARQGGLNTSRLPCWRPVWPPPPHVNGGLKCVELRLVDGLVKVGSVGRGSHLLGLQLTARGCGGTGGGGRRVVGSQAAAAAAATEGAAGTGGSTLRVPRGAFQLVESAFISPAGQAAAPEASPAGRAKTRRRFDTPPGAVTVPIAFHTPAEVSTSSRSAASCLRKTMLPPGTFERGPEGREAAWDRPCTAHKGSGQERCACGAANPWLWGGRRPQRAQRQISGRPGLFISQTLPCAVPRLTSFKGCAEAPDSGTSLAPAGRGVGDGRTVHPPMWQCPLAAPALRCGPCSISSPLASMITLG